MQIPKQHSTSLRPTQVWPEKFRKGPIQHAPTRRVDSVSVVTSSMAGKLVPLKMIPLLREDGVLNSRLSINVQMAPTADLLLNPVRVSAMAYLVPKLALERFQDMGTIDRSYNGIAERDGQVVPWFETASFDNDNDVYKALGIHANGDVNTDYVESYNAVWNYIAKQRSAALTLRDKLDSTLAPAFWEHSQMRHVVPTFDAALVEGNIPVSLTGASGQMPVQGIYGRSPAANSGVIDNEGNPVVGNTITLMGDGNTSVEWGLQQIYAELQADGIQISLASIEQARETRAWAQLRSQYQSVSEDWMIDQLLQGIRFNDETLRDPILLDHSDTIVGMNERYATDGESLTKSVADGRTMLDLSIRSPRIETGGVVVIVGQVLPAMIYERQRDYYLNSLTVDELPNRTADELDPQPVEMITNGEVDESHSLPDDLFGYAPLNHRWVRRAPNVGGKYYRASPADAWQENRNRIWSTEVVDPTLGPDFYISTSISHEVFETQNEDPFEWWVSGDVSVTGLTFFGPVLTEALGDYEAVEAQVPTDRLKGDGTDVAPAVTDEN